MAFTWTRGAADPTFRAASAGARDVAPATAVADPAAAQVRAKVGDLLVRLYGYLAANAEQHPALAAAIPALAPRSRSTAPARPPTRSTGCARSYARINTVRAGDPSIPAS